MSEKSKEIRIACHLPKRQMDVLRLLANGNNTKQSAEILNVSQKTVESRRLALMNKVGLFTFAELTKLALRLGLTEIDV